MSEKDFYKKEDTGKREKCINCGEETIVYLVTDTREIDPKPFTAIQPCACEKARMEKEKLEAEQKEKAIFSNTCKKHFPFLECDEDIEEHTFAKFVVNKENKKAFDAAKKATLSYWGGCGLNFVGSYGSGKSRLLKTMLYEKHLKNEDCVFVEYARIFDRIFSTIDKDSKESKKTLIYILTKVKNLAIDELGVGTNSAAKEDLFLNIINERKRKGLVTHFSMNDEGEANLGGRIRSRLFEYAMPVVNNAADYRPIALKEKLEKQKKKNKKEIDE